MKYTLALSARFSDHKNIDQPEFIQGLTKYAERIHDLYFTSHIPPFETDAHNIFLDHNANDRHLQQALALQAETGITVSALYNNIYVPNTLENLKLFINNFRPLYEQGIRSATIPHTLWLKMGLLQKEFPELKLKNTVLRRVRDAQEFWHQAEAGFDYVNIDRLVARDLKTLREIHKAQQKFYRNTGKYVYTSLLLREKCQGSCALITEHQQYSLQNPVNNQDIESNDKSHDYPMHFGCIPNFNKSFNMFNLTEFSFFKSDIDELCQYFDIIKLLGRRQPDSYKWHFRAIEGLCSNNEVLKDVFRNPYLDEIDPTKLTMPIIKSWRTKIKTCRYQCWKCDLCLKVADKLKRLPNI